MPLGQPFQIGHKSGLLLLFIYYLLLFIYSVNIKPPRHRFGFSLASGWQKYKLIRNVFTLHARKWLS